MKVAGRTWPAFGLPEAMSANGVVGDGNHSHACRSARGFAVNPVGYHFGGAPTLGSIDRVSHVAVFGYIMGATFHPKESTIGTTLQCWQIHCAKCWLYWPELNDGIAYTAADVTVMPVERSPIHG